MGPDEELYSQVSGSLATISALQIPHRQPSWSREIAICLGVIGSLSPNHYTAQDYASMSRFLTRASSEKQLVLDNTEAVAMFRLLLSFLKDGGNSCRAERNSGFTMGAIVLHEVMRATVQLLIDCSSKLLEFRVEALEVLLLYCDPKALDAETRYAAVDAVGTILLSLAANSDKDGDNDHSLDKLYALSEISVQMLLENLRNSTNILSNHGGEGMDGIPSKLLVSILRALSQSMVAYASHAKRVSMRFSSLFLPHFQSIVQSLHVLFERVLPLIDRRAPTTKDFSNGTIQLSSNLNARKNEVRREARSVSGSRGRERSGTAEPRYSTSSSISASSPVTKMWIGSLRLLGALASFNPGAFMGSWQLFLTNSLAVDSDTTQTVNRMIQSCQSDEFSQNSRVNHRKEISSSQMKSPVYSALLLAVNPAVRAEAAKTLRLMVLIDPKHLKKWIRLQSNSYDLILGEASMNKLDVNEKVRHNYLIMPTPSFAVENQHDS